MLSEPEKIKHLLNRAAYGNTPDWWSHPADAAAVLKQLFDTSMTCKPLQVVGTDQLAEWQLQKQQDPGAFQKVVTQQFKDQTKTLNTLWMTGMMTDQAVLREKLAVFWHNHFAVRVNNPYFNQQYLDVIRRNALGNFGVMLREVSKTPAMLNFLNNQQNRKDHPNENFAREVMELFTLGRDNYTEQDIKEAARAFTGWGFDKEGQYKFRPALHDFGAKTLLGKTGNFDGDDVLSILLEQKACARFVTRKVYRYFVDEQVDESRVEALADEFYQSGYDIASLLRTIFSAPWFYEEKLVGNKIKSPNDLLVGMFRTVPVSFTNEQALPFLQKMLDQVLLFPPNVAGWPGGRAWIDSSSLLTRMQLPGIIYYDKALRVQPKAELSEMGEGKGQQMMEQMLKKLAVQKLGAKADWAGLLKTLDGNAITEAEIWTKIIAKPIVPANLGLLKKYTLSDDPEDRLKSLVVHSMGLPEYQLC